MDQAAGRLNLEHTEAAGAVPAMLKLSNLQVSWLIGPTAMLATSLVTTAFVAWTDFYTCGITHHRDAITDIQAKLMTLP